MCAAMRRPVEAADLCHLRLIQYATLAPDGDSLCYALAEMDEEGEQEYLSLWLMSLHDGQTQRLSAANAEDYNPQWSPDGSRIAFISTRSNKPQIYLMSLANREARQLTSLSQGVGSDLQWSPDGSKLAFTAGPAEPLDRTRPYRLTRNVYRFDGHGYIDEVCQDIYCIELESGQIEQLTHDQYNNLRPLWSPDGQQLLIHSLLAPTSHNVSQARLRTVDLHGKLADLLGAWGYSQMAAWLPNGQIVFCGQAFGKPRGSKNDLWLIGSTNDQPICRTAALGLHIGADLQGDMNAALPEAILVNADGSMAYLQVQAGGSVPIYAVALTGPEKTEPIITGERSCFPLALRGEQILFGVSTIHNPLDLHCAQLDGSHERQLSDFNAALHQVWQLLRVEHIQCEGADGVPVEGWMLVPTSGEAPYPTVLYIHGGPHYAFGHIFAFDFQLLAGAGYGVLFLNQRGSTGYGDAFATGIIGDWGNHDYLDLMAGVDKAIALGLADPDRLGVCGISCGGFLSCWIICQTDRFKAAVPENSMTNWLSFYGVSDIGPWFSLNELGGHPHEIPEIYRRCSPITYAHRCTTPTLLIVSEHDYRCPAEQSEQFYTTLKVNNCPVEMLRLPNSSHAGSIYGPPAARKAQNEALLTWMQHYV